MRQFTNIAEQFKERDKSEDLKWYILYVFTPCNLQKVYRYINSVVKWIPHYKVILKRGYDSICRTEQSYPGYIFIGSKEVSSIVNIENEMAKDGYSFYFMKGLSQELYCLSEDDIEGIDDVCSRVPDMKYSCDNMKVNTPVHINSGPLNGMNGKVVEIYNKSLLLEVNFNNKVLSIRLNKDNYGILEKINETNYN